MAATFYDPRPHDIAYAGAFFLAGAALVALMYFFLGQALDRQVTAQVGITKHLATPSASDSGSLQLAHAAQEALQTQFERDRDETLGSMLITSLAPLGLVGVVAAGSGWLLAGRALHPLLQITATARRVADRSLHERIALAGPDDEIKDLAGTFDAMLERLDRSFDSQPRFVANASHELRTPLTINRSLIEVALDNPEADESLRQLAGKREAGLGLSILRSVAQAHDGEVSASPREGGGLTVRVRIRAARGQPAPDTERRS